MYLYVNKIFKIATKLIEIKIVNKKNVVIVINNTCI